MNEKLKEAFASVYYAQPSEEFNHRLMEKIHKKQLASHAPKESRNVLFIFLFLIFGLPFIVAISALLFQNGLPVSDVSIELTALTGSQKIVARIWSEWQVAIVFLFVFFGLRFFGRSIDVNRNLKSVIKTT